MKNYNFIAIFQNFNENFEIFTKIFKNFSNFSRKFTDKSELCSSRCSAGGSAPPRTIHGHARTPRGGVSRPSGGCHGHTLTWSGGIFWTRPKACRGVAEWGVPGGWAPGRRRNFRNFFIKKPMENYHFRPIFHNFNENLVKNVSNFWEKFRSIHLYGVRGAEPPEARDFIKK